MCLNGICETDWNMNLFLKNGRSKAIESAVIAMEYESPNGTPGFRGCCPLIPGCVTIQKTMGAAHRLAAICAEAIDLKKE
jgi:hypothetical protein